MCLCKINCSVLVYSIKTLYARRGALESIDIINFSPDIIPSGRLGSKRQLVLLPAGYCSRKEERDTENRLTATGSVSSAIAVSTVR